MNKVKVGIANWTEGGRPLGLVAIVELRVGDSAGDLAERGFRTVNLEPVAPGTLEASFTHDVRYTDRPKNANSAEYSFGAGLPDLPADARYRDGWSGEKYARLQALAERWHLNAMRAGCVHQIADGWGKRPIDPSKPTTAYGRHFNGQRQDSWNLLGWVRPDEHPEGLMTRPCPTCNYKYWSAWLVEVLPPGVLAELADLVGVRPPVPV